MERARALQIANEAKRMLAPFCERIEIAGSIRRLKPEVKDIELVCIPKTEAQQNLLQETLQENPVPGFIATVNQWEKVRGEPTGKYTQRLLPGGIALDLFITTPQSWGLIYAIRTGSADFSHKTLAVSWIKKGFHSKDGVLIRAGKHYHIREEQELFDIIGLPWIEPQNRI